MTKRLSSSTPALNHLGGELAIALEQYNVVRLVPQHVPGVMNFEPDWLSRPHDRSESVPDNLKKIKIKQLAPVTAEDFTLAPLVPNIIHGRGCRHTTCRCSKTFDSA